ncbi:hypothetical protein HanRHA438_Chr10g0451421 [Helianthus annuus]|nr:hypothetical protein HanIR_Chr10g0473521 [Helianthus annuus]KAJ0879433.1 hypothetical protein HanRHA438_Chr10g0451421 [Helianthus annuus]
MNTRFPEDRREGHSILDNGRNTCTKCPFVRRHWLRMKPLFPINTLIFDRFSTLEDLCFCSRKQADPALPSIHFRPCVAIKHAL